MAIGLLEKYSGLRATVLDLPDVVQIAPEHVALSEPTIRGRLEYVAGDMFESVPEADGYIMKHIIHDWDDEKCIRMLENCRRSMRGEGRVLCMDTVVQPMDSTWTCPDFVESRLGASADAEAPSRFPAPLIKPDVPISSIRLSD